MKLRFTPRAAFDLEAIHTYIANNNPDAATAVVERIGHSAQMLETFPYMGHEGLVVARSNTPCQGFRMLLSIVSRLGMAMRWSW